MQPGTLHFISGRLAAGKTTLARRLVAEHHAVLFCEDVCLSKLCDVILSFDDYLKWSRRCRSLMGPLIIDIPRAGASVVLDFAWKESMNEHGRVLCLNKPGVRIFSILLTLMKRSAYVVS